MTDKEELVKDTQSDPLPPLENIYFMMIQVLSAKDLEKADFTGSSDPFCKVEVNGQSWRTKTIQKNLNPCWNEETQFVFFNPVEEIEFCVYDDDQGSKDDLIGRAKLPTAEYKIYDKDSKGFKGWIPLKDCKKGSIEVCITGRVVKPLILEQRCEEMTQECAQQEEKIRKKDEECRGYMAKNAQYAKECQSYKEECDRLNRECEDLKQQCGKKEKENKSKLNTIQRYKEEKEKLENKCKKKEAECENKRQQIAQEKKKYEEAQNEYNDLTEQIDTYQQENDDYD